MSKKRTLVKPALILFSDVPNISQINYITDTEFLIGRSPESNLIILQRYVSRKHCTFRLDESTNQWYILSHSRGNVSVRGKVVKAGEPFQLQCGDTIKISSLLVFEFKCSPDSEMKCCLDLKKTKLSVTNSENEHDESVNFETSTVLTETPLQEPVTSTLPLSSVANSPHKSIWASDIPSPEFNSLPEPEIQSIDASFLNSIVNSENISTTNFSPELSLMNSLSGSQNDYKSTIPLSAESSTDYEVQSIAFSDSWDDFNSEINISSLNNQILKYLRSSKNSTLSSTCKENITEELNRKLEFLKKLEEFCSPCKSTEDTNSFVEMFKNVCKFLKNNLQSNNHIYSVLKNKDLQFNQIIELTNIHNNLNFLYMEKVVFFMEKIEKFIKINMESSCSSSENHYFKEKSQICNIKEHEQFYQIELEKNKLALEIEKCKENMTWNETRVSYLEMKLKEKEKVESKIETLMEESTVKENTIAKLKRDLANLEIIELKYKCLQETSKFLEADKRNKDSLQKTIDSLKNEIKDLKSTNTELKSINSKLTEEKFELNEKNDELETKLKEKSLCTNISCSEASDENYCCDMVKEIKGSLIDLLEREFQCSICGEMFVKATVTRCGHIFCSYCLHEWKSKQKRCPICRQALTKEVTASIVDDYITGLLKLISDKMYSERLKVISDRTVTQPVRNNRASTGRRSGRNAVVNID